MRVLVVDDDVVVHMTLELALADVEVVEAFSVDEACERGPTAGADGFVIGRWIRGVDGLQAVRRLRRDLRTNRTPIIVLSAGPDTAEYLLALQAGADAYLPKPVEPDVVDSCLHALIAVDPGLRRDRRRRGIEALQHGLEPEPLVVDLRERVAEDDHIPRHRGWWHRHDARAGVG